MLDGDGSGKIYDIPMKILMIGMQYKTTLAHEVCYFNLGSI
jgi:hypothetical protein